MPFATNCSAIAGVQHLHFRQCLAPATCESCVETADYIFKSDVANLHMAILSVLQAAGAKTVRFLLHCSQWQTPLLHGNNKELNMDTKRRNSPSARKQALYATLFIIGVAVTLGLLLLGPDEPALYGFSLLSR